MYPNSPSKLLLGFIVCLLLRALHGKWKWKIESSVWWGGAEMKMEMRLIKSRSALENMPPKGLNDASQAKWRTRSAIKGFRCTAAAPLRAQLRERAKCN